LIVNVRDHIEILWGDDSVIWLSCHCACRVNFSDSVYFRSSNILRIFPPATFCRYGDFYTANYLVGR
jgi:hypothetical protein